ncbi:peptidoglycan-binding protein [Actinomadura sp. LOL_016]|uniref:peptidoglycan-binding domain-containing protein n=1 Tax=unclassified Actinomadura TaxID=2626254 RepID=UPI003A7FEA46
MMFVPAVAAVTAIAGVGAASADGPDTDPRVAKAIELQAWVPIDVGDRGHRVAFVRCALTRLGYYNNCDPTGTSGDLYLQNMVGAVERFQAAVEAYQKRKKIGVDGYFGPQTFRAALAAGAERRNTPGL